MTAPTLAGDRVLLRAGRAADLADLLAIAVEEPISRWWGPPDVPGLEAKLGGRRDDAVLFVIEVAGVVAGAIEFHEEETPEFRHAGIDVFLGGAWQGRGLGVEAISLVVDHLLDVRGHHRVTIDPAAANERAIRCYAAVGFRPVGIMRQYQRLGDGRWHDGLLMDLVREDVR